MQGGPVGTRLAPIRDDAYILIVRAAALPSHQRSARSDSADDTAARTSSLIVLRFACRCRIERSWAAVPPSPGQPGQSGDGGERQRAAGRAGHQHERAEQHRGHHRDLEPRFVEVPATQALRVGVSNEQVNSGSSTWN